MAVYFLKVRPFKKVTTTFFLWEKVFTEKKSTALFNRFRDLFSLLLMILVFFLLSSALSKPTLTDNTNNKKIIILLDNSASMSALEDKGIRLDLAKEKAKNLIKGFGYEQEAVIASISDSIIYHQNLSNHPKSLMEGVDKIKFQPIPVNTKRLEAFVKMVRLQNEYRILFISDGSFKQGKWLDSVEKIVVGTKKSNYGIIGFDIQQMINSKDTALYFQLISNDLKVKSVVLKLTNTLIDKTVKIFEVDCEPGINNPIIYRIDTLPPSKYELSLEVKDALEIDNIAFGYLKKALNIKMSIQSSSPWFLEKAVNAFRKSMQRLQLVDKNQEITLIHNSNSELPDNAIIFLQPTTSNKFFKIMDGKPFETIAKVKLEKHPVLKFASIEGSRFSGVQNIELIEGSIVLVEDLNGVPLIWKCNVGDQKAYVMNFDFDSSVFFLNVNFPILLYSMSVDLSDINEWTLPYWKTGDSIPILKKTEVKLPNQKLKMVSEKIHPLDQIGFYELTNEKQVLPVNLFSSFDSQLDPKNFKDSLQGISIGYPISYYLIIITLIIIILEMIAYHKRWVG